MKKLRRSRRTKVLGGVAAGFADYFGMDVTVMRLLFALLGIMIPNTILAYILAWIIMPEEAISESGGVLMQETSPKTVGLPLATDEGAEGTAENGAESFPESVAGSAAVQPTARVDSGRNRQFFGYILVAFGLIVLAKRYVPSYMLNLPLRLIGLSRHFWPVVLIVLGAALIAGSFRGR